MTNARLLALGSFALLLPISIENPAATDSLTPGPETRISVIGGIGHYAIIDRGCEGQVLETHPHEFSESGVEARHRFPSEVEIGMRAGVVRDRAQETVTDYSVFPPRDSTIEVKDDVTYYNPYIAHEGRVGGIGAGWILSSGDFGNEGNKTVLPWSAHLRLGSLDGPYFRVAVMEGFPLYAGGGYAEAGLGWRPSRLMDAYVGISGGPYDGPGLMMKLDYRIQRNFAVVLRGRGGNSGGEPQSGVGLGITYVSRPPRDPVRGAHHQRSDGLGSSWGLAPKRPPAEKTAPNVPRPPASQRPAEYGTYQQVDSLPVLLQRAPCAAADSSGEAGVSATVMVAALIGEDGHVREVKVVGSVPERDAAALDCVRQWIFRPAKRSGWPVAYWLAVPVTFEP